MQPKEYYQNLYIGTTNINTQGLTMEVIAYEKATDITVKFENGDIIKNKAYGNFKTGKIESLLYTQQQKDLKIGETVVNISGLKMKLIEYRSNADVDVLFEDGTIIMHRQYKNFQKGIIKNFNTATLCGVGYIGKGKYNSLQNKNIYSKWSGMFIRCYDEDYRYRYPTYITCTVCDEWHCFQNFAKWYDENYYEVDEHIMDLDKDILTKGNKIYSPDNCIFVPQNINKLFIKYNKGRGNCVIGVSNKLNKYSATCSHNALGYFDTEEQAYNTYKKFKENMIKQVADKYKEQIPQNLYDALYRYKVEITD